MLFGRKNLFVSVYSGYAERKGDGKLSSSSGSVWLRDDEFCLVVWNVRKLRRRVDEYTADSNRSSLEVQKVV